MPAATPEAVAERPTAVVTGTSREVGPHIVIGLVKRGWNIVGGHNRANSREPQEELVRQVEGLGGRMVFVEANLLDKDTPSKYVAAAKENFGGVNAVVSNTAGGYGLTIEESLAINRDAQVALFQALRPLMRPESVFAYNQSVPGHLFGHEAIGEIPGKYPPVAKGKMIAGRTFRAMFSQIPGDEVRYAEAVGNGLRDALVTKMVIRGERDLPDNQKMSSKWEQLSWTGELPTTAEYAADIVDMITGKYPSGHTAYTGLREALRPFRTVKGRVEMTRMGVETVIPHRGGVLLLEKVVELTPGKRAVAEMVKDATHPMLQLMRGGHFPGQPITMGAIITEALAQTGAVGIFSQPEMADSMGIFREIEGMKFKKMATPGDRIILDVGDYDVTTKMGATFGTGRGIARDESGKVLADGKLVFTIAPKPSKAD